MARSITFLTMPLIVPATICVCAVEIATLGAALRSDLSVTSIAVLLACFHAGYLVADPLRKRVSLDGRALAVATVTVAICLCFVGTFWSVPVTAAVLFLFNAVAQSVRRSVKQLTPVPSLIKNAGKALGMALGGALGAFHYGPLGLMILMPSLVVAPRGSRLSIHHQAPEKAATRRDRLLLWGEFFHHVHYFAYCYSFWYLAPSLISPWTGVWFVLGWLAYFLAERAWREGRRRFSPKGIAVGHGLVVVALLAMPHANSVGVLLAWFLTGIGGGTAYMLGNAGHQGPRERFEDAGHVSGLILAALLALLMATNRQAATVTVTAGACLALITAIIFMSISPSERDRATQGNGEERASR